MRKLIVFLIVLDIVLILLNLLWDESPMAGSVHDMANRNIVWSYAGK